MLNEHRKHEALRLCCPTVRGDDMSMILGLERAMERPERHSMLKHAGAARPVNAVKSATRQGGLGLPAEVLTVSGHFSFLFVHWKEVR